MGGFLDPNCPYHAMGSHPPGGSSPILPCYLTSSTLPLVFPVEAPRSPGGKTPRTRRRETLRKNAIQIDNATKNKANFCWQECSISTMLLVEGIWLANFWLVSVSSTVVCLLVAEKWEKKQQKEGFGYWGRAIGSCLALNIGLFEEIVPFWTCVEEILSKTPQIQRIRIEL